MTTLKEKAPLRLRVLMLKSGEDIFDSKVIATWQHAFSTGRATAEAECSNVHFGLASDVFVGLVANWGPCDSLGGSCLIRLNGADHTC